MKADLLEEVQRLIDALESHPDPTVRADATALLQGIDAVHRTALTHLVGAIQSMAGEAFLNRLAADPAIRLLLMSYELLAVDRRLLAEEALDAVRGHLHDHGIDVELAEVVGGAVYVRLHGLEHSGSRSRRCATMWRRRSGRDCSAFRSSCSASVRRPGRSCIQVGGLRSAQRPVYRRACAAIDVPPGRMSAVDVEGQPILIVNVDGQLHAVLNRCGDTPLPLHFGTVQGAELRCSWHGCRYDVRTGKRLDGGIEHLAVVPVAVEGDEIRVAVGVEPARALTVRTLIAGFGNVLRGDDGFGVEVIRRLQEREPMPDVEVMEVGTAGIRLAQELLTPCDRLIIVDAMRRGDRPARCTSCGWSRWTRPERSTCTWPFRPARWRWRRPSARCPPRSSSSAVSRRRWTS